MCKSMDHTLGKKDLDSLDNSREENKTKTVTKFVYLFFLCISFTLTRKQFFLQQIASLELYPLFSHLYT